MKETVLYRGIPIVGRMPLFTADNRQAIRDNLKTQTRRVIKQQPEEVTGDLLQPYVWYAANKGAFSGDPDREIKCPYGKVGDVRCMCEPLMRGATTGVAYYRDDDLRAIPVISLITGKPLVWRWKRDYLASIHMPTEAARTICRTTGIRVERLQAISEEDAIAEGAVYYMAAGGRQAEEMSMRAQFGMLWNSINAKKGYGWDIPQMVWVIVFEKLEV